MNINEKIKVKEIAELTDNNNHVEALRLGISLLAGTDGRSQLDDRLDFVESSHFQKGYLDTEAYNERYAIWEDFKEQAVHEFSHEDYSKIYGAF